MIAGQRQATREEEYRTREWVFRAESGDVMRWRGWSGVESWADISRGGASELQASAAAHLNEKRARRWSDDGMELRFVRPSSASGTERYPLLTRYPEVFIHLK